MCREDEGGGLTCSVLQGPCFAKSLHASLHKNLGSSLSIFLSQSLPYRSFSPRAFPIATQHHHRHRLLTLLPIMTTHHRCRKHHHNLSGSAATTANGILHEVVFLSALGARFGLISSYWSEFGYPSDGSSGGG
ncbi:hypothetical protein C1H46_005587 [Malus baccata]|uniref:Uncharacterized protein n=1 Tax=Malus baccata TaxID=106549 RepID=A0A540NCH3_MALBA|nr:hypothetical protein C1H46_005587 [Malus baccata]